ncbi:tRNA modification GTPase MnmE [Rubripirellula tenax]|uniref:tRNA modification GTPase MnmE n=2 Tax=Rubripirellula tenax TaxID=2528015 RepID=A0A5C6EMM7_9BACT|nr:tRNA modification GTPase MnmE [Rubripirellula tenax]
MSGPDVAATLASMGIPSSGLNHTHRFTSRVDLGDPLGHLALDIMLWPDRRSYTGQPSAELHTVGSLPVLSRLTDVAVSCGARAARPGEFTMRAFLAGRLDLTQAEAVLGVIDAEGRGSLDHALRQLSGNLSRPLESMRSTLLDLLADVEAGLDFVDEDIEFVSDENLIARLEQIVAELAETARVMQQRGGGAARAKIALRGEPNAGKSQLLNCLTTSQTAIVADVAGTTRDVVSIDGFVGDRRVLWLDTAGIEAATDGVSQQSQDQATEAARHADVRLWCIDGSRSDYSDAVRRLRDEATTSGRTGVVDFFLATKCDLVDALTIDSNETLVCSAVTGDGIDGVIDAIRNALDGRDAEETGSVVGTAARCRQSLDRAQEAIVTAIELTRTRRGHEFVSAEMRLAAQCLGEVTGAVYTDDILDRVFGRFCIGK